MLRYFTVILLAALWCTSVGATVDLGTYAHRTQQATVAAGVIDLAWTVAAAAPRLDLALRVDLDAGANAGYVGVAWCDQPAADAAGVDVQQPALFAELCSYMVVSLDPVRGVATATIGAPCSRLPWLEPIAVAVRCSGMRCLATTSAHWQTAGYGRCGVCRHARRPRATRPQCQLGYDQPMFRNGSCLTSDDFDWKQWSARAAVRGTWSAATPRLSMAD